MILSNNETIFQERHDWQPNLPSKCEDLARFIPIPKYLSQFIQVAQENKYYSDPITNQYTSYNIHRQVVTIVQANR